MTASLSRTVRLALVLPLAAGCAGAPLIPTPGAARYESELARAAAVISPEAVLQNLSVIADDSMGGRNTPSTGLDQTAKYFAARYAEWGIRPAGENGTYFQRYPLVARGLRQSDAYLDVAEATGPTRFRMGDLAYVTGGWVATPTHARGLILGGAMTAQAVAAAPVKGHFVVLVSDTAKATTWRTVQRAVLAAGPVGVMVIDNTSLERFTRARTAALNPRLRLALDDGQGPPVFTVHDSLLRVGPNVENRPDWDQIRASTTPVVQELPAEVEFSFFAADTVVRRASAPNVVGMIEGSDPLLKNEYVIYSAHMDHVGTAGDGVGGCRTIPATATAPADSICNGADDDGSGSTGVLLIAHAYSQLKVKPRRSIVFLHVSGEEKGLLGSQWFAEHPTIPLDKVVADINNDMIGRNSPDSIVVIGKEHSDMGTTLARVSARHPELALTASDDIWPEERFYFRSDHYNFARKGIPILFFFNGVHPQYHRADDHVALIDTSKLSRVARLGFYLGAEIANTTARPAWVPESYKEIVEGSGGR